MAIKGTKQPLLNNTSSVGQSPPPLDNHLPLENSPEKNL